MDTNLLGLEYPFAFEIWNHEDNKSDSLEFDSANMFNFSPVFHGLAVDLILAFNKVKVKGDNGKFAIEGKQCICILHLLK